jgi:nucleoside-diphosphate-sugar epimerase
MASSVLVTGEAGFIGHHLVEHLIDSGHRVRILDLSTARFAHFVHIGGAIIRYQPQQRQQPGLSLDQTCHGAAVDDGRAFAVCGRAVEVMLSGDSAESERDAGGRPQPIVNGKDW